MTLYVVLLSVPEDVREVTRLLVEHVREVHREPGLHDAEDEQVREAADVHAVEGRGAVRPLLGQGDPVAAVQLASGSSRERGADLETSREDQAVDLVLDPVDDHARSR